MASTIQDAGDDAFGIVCGDLGMGEGLKPGGLLPLQSPKTPSNENYRTSTSSNLSESKRLFCYEDFDDPEYATASCESKRTADVTSKDCECSTSSCGTTYNPSNEEYQLCQQSDSCECDTEDFPSYADVPLGTSLRQQKKLYEKNLGTIIKNHTQAPIVVQSEKKQLGKVTSSERRRLSSFEIEKKLADALTEVGELKIEIETCRRRLDAKYRAIAILKKQAEEAREESLDSAKMTKEYNNVLAKFEELEVVRFEAEVKGKGQTTAPPKKQLQTLINFEDIDDDYCRVCQENAVLMSTLEARSEELRRTNAQKMALSRERDELMALMDVKEKLKYEKTKSQSSEDEYGTFSSTELAVLGACRCRGSNPEPCGCAHAAASLRREIIKLREEIDLQKQRTEETYLTVDAYRKAFEEQLYRNKELSLKLSELCVPSVSKSVKAKAAIKWLISVLNDDDIEPSQHVNGVAIEQSGQRMYGDDIQSLNNTTLMPPQQLVNLLTEMVHEKNEALAHQKLAAQVLASKNKQLEEQVTAIKDDDVFKYN